MVIVLLLQVSGEPNPTFGLLFPNIAAAKLTAAQTIATAEVTAIQNAVAAKQALFTNLFGGLGK